MPSGLYAVLGLVVGASGGVLGLRALRSGFYRDATDPPQRSLGWVVPASAATGALTAFGLREWPAVVIATGLIAAIVGVVLMATDVDVHRIPRAVTWPSYPALLALLAVCSVRIGDLDPLRRALWVGATLWGGYYLLHRAARRRGLGRGDVTLAGLIGLLLGWFGWETAAAATYLTFALGGVIAAVLLLTRRVRRADRIAFGPAMIAGALVLLVCQ